MIMRSRPWQERSGLVPGSVILTVTMVLLEDSRNRTSPEAVALAHHESGKRYKHGRHARRQE
jgi:hypothetical protein